MSLPNDNGGSNTGDNSNDKSILRLVLSNKLSQENIVDDFVLNDNSYFVLKLNHGYKQKIIPFQFDFGHYQKSMESFERLMASNKDVKPEHAKMVTETIDLNHEHILEFRKSCEAEEGDDDSSKSHLREHVVCKYSNRGKGDLHEAVILEGKPVFIKYDGQDGQIKIVEKITEANRIIRPPFPEEYPYTAYEFSSIEEIQAIIAQTKEESIGSLYLKAKSFVQDYNPQDDYKLTLIAMDSIFSYFQDKFATTHYDSIVGDNDSGKTSIGTTFEAIGYRPVYMTDPSPANIFRCLGSIESGQCTIIIDEADKIDKSPEMMAILKTGYQFNGKVPKINTNTLRQEFFYSYCFKMIIGERSMSLSEAKGVNDRTFSFTTYAGDSLFDIKETLNPQGNPDYQRGLNGLVHFRRLMLIYRLVHFKDPVVNIDVGLKRRNRELCKPLMQLFYSAESPILKEISLTLQEFLNVKKERKYNTIEAVLHPIITGLVSIYGKEISASDIWNAVVQGGLEGHYDIERKPNEYQTADYGTIYRNTVTNIICDKFGAKKKHREKGSVLVFDPEKLAKVGKSYELKTKIQLKLLEPDPDGSDGSDGFIQTPTPFKENADVEIINIDDNNSTISNSSSMNDVKNIIEQNEKEQRTPMKPSEPSEPSAITRPAPISSKAYWNKNSGLWHCRTKNCRYRGDKWDMEKHFHHPKGGGAN